MRVQVRVEMNTAAGNKAVKDGSIKTVIQKFVEKFKPEAAYFFPGEGKRCAIFYLDMKESSQLPAIVEPWWFAVEATCTVTPCMNAEELAKGLASLG